MLSDADKASAENLLRPVTPPAAPKRPRGSTLLCCRRRVREPVSVEVVLEEDIWKQILSFCSLGSLQMMSMANKTWLTQAYVVATVDVDMKDWPFCIKQLKGDRAKQRGEFFLEDFDLTADERLPSSLKDSGATDTDLKLALGRLRSTQLRKLVASSSLLTSSSVCWVLDTFADGLQELSLSGRFLVGAEIQASLEKCLALSSLHVEHVEVHPPLSANLVQLTVGSGVMSELWPHTYFQHLQVLSFIPNVRLCPHRSPVEVHDWFLHVFEHSHQLREISIYNVTQVTNRMLAVLLENVPNLKKFSGCYTGPTIQEILAFRDVMFPFSNGPRALAGGSLATEAVDAFKAAFPNGEIFIDDVYTDMLNDDFDDLGSDFSS